MWKFYALEGSRGLKCVTVPNFMAISQVVAELWRFFDFKDAAVRHLGFLKVRILTAGRVEKINVRHHAKFRADRSNRCFMAIHLFVDMAAVRNLAFVFHVFGPPTRSIWLSLSLHKIWLESMQ